MKTILTRICTFIALIIISIICTIELPLSISLLSVVYLFSGKQFELMKVSATFSGWITDFKYVEDII